MRLRENKIEIQGRSLLINVVAIIINIVAVFYIAKGFHQSAGDGAVLYKSIGFVLLIASIVGLVVLKGMFMLSYVARAFVGGLFIVSGLVKANDPWGFAFKLEEYFSPMGLAYDMPFFEIFSPYVLQLSIIICVAEIVLGIAVIVGGKIKLTSWLLLIMMLFFTWLTYYTFSCVSLSDLMADKGVPFDRECVRDCGCFGDALKGSVGRSLTPYESFWKDLVLFYFVLIIFLNQWKIELNTYKENWVMAPAALLVVIFFSWVFGWYFPILFYVLTILGAYVVGNMNIGKVAKPWKMAGFVGLIALLFSLYTTNYLPIKDYRPYAIGNSIIDQMNNGKDEVATYSVIYKNKQTGLEETFDSGDYEIYGDTSKYVFVNTKVNVIEAGKLPSISDFVLVTDYENLSSEEKQNPILDSIISMDFENYYESKLIVNSRRGADTINKYNYAPFYVDTAFGGDTIFYERGKEFYGLVDSQSPFRVNVTNYILSLDQVILVTIRDIETHNVNAIDQILDIYKNATENDVPMYILTPASDDQMDKFKSETGLNTPHLSIDGVEVKIPVRSNPGLILFKNAVVVEKYGSRSIPSFERIMEKF